MPAALIRSATSDRGGMLDSVATRVSSARFVGRSAELDALRRALAEAQAGRPSVVLIGGEAGVGKTRLVAEFSLHATRSGVQVLVGGNVELGEEGMPFAPVSAALRGLVRDLAPEAAEALLAPGRDELARLLPELGPVAARTEAGRGRLFEALLDLVERLGQERPLLLIVEDLHWADRSTRELLAFLARSLRDARVLIVVTYRSDEVHRGHPLRAYLAELDRVSGVHRHQLERLTAAEVADQLTALLGAPAEPWLAQRVYDRSEGNAFFVEEIVCAELFAEESRLTDSLRDLLLARLERLAPRTQTLLRVASVGSRHVDYGLLAAVSELSEDELAETLREAVSSHALVAGADETGFSFRHSLVREALHEDLLPGEHGRVHRRYAEALERDPTLVPPARLAAEIAHHWHAANDAERGLPAALAAAQTAREVYAFAEQRQMLERALEMWDQVPADRLPPGLDHADLLARASRAAFKAGDHDRALALIDAALAEVDVAANPDRAALLHDQRSLVLTNLGRPGGLQALRLAASLLTPESSPKVRAQVLTSLARALMIATELDEAMQLAAEAGALAESIGESAYAADAEVTYATALVYLERLDEGLAKLSAALKAAEGRVNPWVVLRARTNLSDALQRLGRYEEAIAVATEGMERARRIGRARTTGAFLAGNVIDPLLSLGRWDEAEVALAEALELRPPGVQALNLHLQQATLAGARGDLATAERCLAAVRKLLRRQPGDAQYAMPLAAAEAHLALIHGDPAQALDHLEPALSSGEAGVRRHRWPVAATAARAAAELARRGRDLRDPADQQRATVVVDRLRGLTAGLGTSAPPDLAWQAQAAAELSRAEGTDDTRPVWAQAVASWESVGSPYPLAYCLLRGAEAAAAAGDRGQAERQARQSAALAASLRAAPLAAEIEQLAQRARLKLSDEPAPAAKPVDEASRLGLTAREVDVLRAITAGQTNRQIAEELFISIKTVSVHVSNILGKLDVSGRGEAAALAHRLRLFSPDRLTPDGGAQTTTPRQKVRGRDVR